MAAADRRPLDIARAKAYHFPMSFAELDIAPRTRGRAPVALQVDFVRALEPSDLALLASQRGSVPKPLAGPLRERHHALARVLAQGMSPGEAAAVTGYSLSRISILSHDPAFVELLSHYRVVENSLAADWAERAGQLSLTAMDAMLEKLEDDPESVPDTLKLEIAKSFADRTGHAPVQKNLNINANVDLGNRLSAARRRVAQGRITVTSIENVEEGSGGSMDSDET